MFPDTTSLADRVDDLLPSASVKPPADRNAYHFFGHSVHLRQRRLKFGQGAVLVVPRMDLID